MTRPRPLAERPLAAARSDVSSTTFWSAAAEGRLLFQRCPACGHRQFYPRALCTACGGDTGVGDGVGPGDVHTFTVVRQNGAKPFRTSCPTWSRWSSSTKACG